MEYLYSNSFEHEFPPPPQLLCVMHDRKKKDEGFFPLQKAKEFPARASKEGLGCLQRVRVGRGGRVEARPRRQHRGCGLPMRCLRPAPPGNCPYGRTLALLLMPALNGRCRYHGCSIRERESPEQKRDGAVEEQQAPHCGAPAPAARLPAGPPAPPGLWAKMSSRGGKSGGFFSFMEGLSPPSREDIS